MTTNVARPSALELARRSLAIDLLCEVGTAATAECVEPVRTWKQAAQLITDQLWTEYITDVRNNIVSVLIRKGLTDEANAWNQVGEEINAIFRGAVISRLESIVPRNLARRDKIIIGARNIIAAACMERHYADFVESDYFLQMYEWLERGHLVCGVVEEYPAKHWYVF